MDFESLIEKPNAINPGNIKEKYIDNNINSGNDFPSMATDFCKKINFKIAFFLGILTFFVLSDFFIENLPLESGYINGNDTEFKGALIQLICIVVGYILIDLLSQCEII